MLQTFPKALCSRVLSYEIPKAFDILWASLVAHMVKKLPAMQETWDRKIPGRRELRPTPVFLPGNSMGRGACQGLQRVGHDSATNTHTHTYTHRQAQSLTAKYSTFIRNLSSSRIMR